MTKEEAKDAMFDLEVEVKWGSNLHEREVDDLDFEEGNYPLPAFIEYLKAVIAETPDQEKPFLYTRFELNGDGWLSRPSVYVIRPKTDAEIAEEEAAKKAREDSAERQQWRLYNQLKAKFEP